MNFKKKGNTATLPFLIYHTICGNRMVEIRVKKIGIAKAIPIR